jgi:hypothetical protein
VARCDEHVRVLRDREALPVSGERPLEVAGQVTREAEVVPDVRVQRARRDVPGVREPVRLDFVGRPGDEPSGRLEVRGRDVETPDRNVPMPAVTVELRVRREFRDSGREERDRVAVAAEVRGPTTGPDVGVGVLRLFLEAGPCVREARLPVALRLRVERGREERLAEERPRLGARRKLVLGTRERLPPRRRARGEKRDREEQVTAPRD